MATPLPPGDCMTHSSKTALVVKVPLAFCIASSQRCVTQIQLSIVCVNIFISMQDFLCLKNYHSTPSCFEQLHLSSSAFLKEKVPF